MTQSSTPHPAADMSLSDALAEVTVTPGQGAEVIQALITLISDPDLAKRLRDGVTALVHNGSTETASAPARSTATASSSKA